jgi:hypothetical protein
MLAAIGAVAAAVVTGVYAFLVWRTLRAMEQQRIEMQSQRAEMVEQRAEMQRTREAQLRAHVTVELWPWDRRYTLFDVGIRNYGAGAARNVRVVFDPDFRQPQYGGGTMNELEMTRHVPFLAPNDEIRWFVGTDRWIYADDLPPVWAGRVEYDDAVGHQTVQFTINTRQWDRLRSMLPGDGPEMQPPVRPGWAPVRQRDPPPPPPRIMRNEPTGL